MSYTKEVTLWCEAENCQQWVGANNYESNGGSVSAARISARRAGWTYIGGKDHCRQHSTVAQKIVPDPLYDGSTVSLADLRSGLVRPKDG